MSFELALKEVTPIFTSDDGVELQIRPIKSTDSKTLLGFFKSLPAPELMFFKHRVTDPDVTPQRGGLCIILIHQPSLI